MKKMGLAICSALGFFGSGQAQNTFSYTGSVQTYTTPACAASVTVDVRGAAGANSSYSNGGLGGRVVATIPVQPNETWNIYVGQSGQVTTGGWNGGGSSAPGGAAGGGASDIRRGGNTLNHRIIVAGGAGGAGLCNVSNSGGGAGGGTTAGADGLACNSSGVAAGKGGTLTGGGAAGQEANPGTPGQLGTGGNGGGYYAGGGGGGYFGGGGGGTNICCWAGGGGGGSSFVISGATGITHTRGFQSGNGQVTISSVFKGTQAPKVIHGPAKACAGDTVTFACDTIAEASAYNWTVPADATIVDGQGSTVIKVVMGSTAGEISVKSDGTCGPSTELKRTIQVSNYPVAKFMAPDSAEMNTLVQFIDSSEYAVSWLWNFGDSISSIEQHPIHIYTKPNVYEVVLVVANSVCKDSISKQVVVYDPSTIGVENSGRSVLEPEIYPVPVEDFLHVRSGTEGLSGSWQVLGLDGRIKLSANQDVEVVGTLKLDTRSLAPGTYVLRVQGNGRSHVLPFVKE